MYVHVLLLRTSIICHLHVVCERPFGAALLSLRRSRDHLLYVSLRVSRHVIIRQLQVCNCFYESLHTGAHGPFLFSLPDSINTVDFIFGEVWSPCILLVHFTDLLWSYTIAASVCSWLNATKSVISSGTLICKSYYVPQHGRELMKSITLAHCFALCVKVIHQYLDLVLACHYATCMLQACTYSAQRTLTFPPPPPPPPTTKTIANCP